MRIQAQLRGKNYQFETKAGLFSKDKIDAGTRLLIEHMDIQSADTVLDIGCGYGVIGIVAAELASKGKVYMVDVDIRAVKYAKTNAELNGIKNAKVLASDGFDEVKHIKFDKIVSHPPTHVPKETIIEFIEGAKKSLKKTGKLYFVTEKRIKPLIKREFERVFDNYYVVEENNEYVVSATHNTL